MAERQRARRVGAHELHLGCLARTRDPPTERGPLGEDADEAGPAELGGEEDVEEARPRDFRSGHGGHGRQVAPNSLGDLARRPPLGLGEEESHVGGVIAVGRLPGNVPQDLGGGQPAAAWS